MYTFVMGKTLPNSARYTRTFTLIKSNAGKLAQIKMNIPPPLPTENNQNQVQFRNF